MSKFLGGGGSKSTSASGFAALPANLQSSFGKIGESINQYTNPNIAGNIARFTPLAQTADETSAFDAIRAGFAPTQQSINSDIALQTNPFNSYVIDEINRQAGGDYSILKQNLNEAGQFGSNRGMLGANDIDLSRTNQIGGFLQDQFNTAMNNALTTLPTARAKDAAGKLGIGEFQRGLDSATNLAPVSALQAGTGMLGPFMSGGTSTQTSGGSGILGGIGGLAAGFGGLMEGAGGAKALASIFSDIRLKESITPVGVENGHNVYEFSYKGDPRRFIGVMAQEVAEDMPEAVQYIGDYLAVDYGKIGVNFREVTHG